MSASLPLYPIWVVDVVGAALMIVFSFLCVHRARQLRKADRDNVIWMFLLWLSAAFALFSLSRSVAHIAKHLLYVSDLAPVWRSLRPFSGSINSIAFIIVGSVTLFFQQVYRINVRILRDKAAIEKSSEELLWLNRNLENIVRERTAELAASESKYRRIFEGSMDIIFMLAADGTFTDINAAGLHILGYKSKEEVMASRFQDFLVAPSSGAAVLEEITKAGYCRDLECRVRTASGELHTWLVSCTANRGPAGDVLGFEGIAKDITERRHMEQQLLQADRLASLGQLSAGVAHEINNPLGMILGYTQLLLRSQEVDAQTRNDLKIIEKHARNCKAIVEDLLNFARSSDSRKGPVDINELVRQTVGVVQHQFRLDDIAVETDLSPEIPPLEGDAEKLRQVLMNLIMNARQAIAAAGTIRLTTRLDEANGVVMVEIADNGCGIPPEIIDKIFDPFFTTKPTGEGTGLGLSVSYGIVKDHLGEITVASRVGEGSTFCVRLPATAGRRRIRPPEAGLEPVTGTRGEATKGESR